MESLAELAIFYTRLLCLEVIPRYFFLHCQAIALVTTGLLTRSKSIRLDLLNRLPSVSEAEGTGMGDTTFSNETHFSLDDLYEYCKR